MLSPRFAIVLWTSFWVAGLATTGIFLVIDPASPALAGQPPHRPQEADAVDVGRGFRYPAIGIQIADRNRPDQAAGHPGRFEQ